MLRETTFDGFSAYEFLSGGLRLVLVTGCGPRIAFLGKQENLLYWQRDGVIRGDWRLHGGHRVWLTRPLADESEDAYMADNDPCTVEAGENFVTAFSPPHPFTKLSRGLKAELLPDGRFRVTNFIRNDGGMICSGGVWAPTCVNPAGKVLRIPLGEPNSTWDLVRIVIPRRFAGNEVLLDDPQITIKGDELRVTPAGTLTKRCVCAPQGVITMEWAERGITFTKTTAYRRDGNYPLGGCNLAAFVGQNNWMAEMETYGEEQSIRPGETVAHEELWQVTFTQ